MASVVAFKMNSPRPGFEPSGRVGTDRCDRAGTLGARGRPSSNRNGSILQNRPSHCIHDLALSSSHGQPTVHTAPFFCDLIEVDLPKRASQKSRAVFTTYEVIVTCDHCHK